MTDFSEIKSTLQARLKELNERAESIDDDLSEEADDDWGDEAIESAGDEVLEEVGEITMAQISQIKLALSKIEAGTYGDCSACGEPIAQGRLEALPSATKCMQCA